MHILATRWRSPPILQRSALRQRVVDDEGSSRSQNSVPWTATYGSLSLIGRLDGTGYNRFFIIFILKRGSKGSYTLSFSAHSQFLFSFSTAAIQRTVRNVRSEAALWYLRPLSTVT